MPSLSPTSVLRRNWYLLVFPVFGLGLIWFASASFYVRSHERMADQLREYLRATAAIAAHTIDASLVDAVHGSESFDSPAFHSLVESLQEVRKDVPTARFAYILRRTDDPMQLEFVADADALSDVAALDRNGNGEVDSDEEPSFPGDLYDVSDIPFLQKEAFEQSITDEDFTVDQWGILISGYAPVRRLDGSTAAVLGIDMTADNFHQLSRSIFSTPALILALLSGILLTGSVALFTWHKRIAELKQIEDERSALIDLAAHQLGAPIATFKWWLEILREQAGKVKNSELAFAEMGEGIARLEAIMQGLRQAYELNETVEARREPLSLLSLLSRLKKEYAPRLKRLEQRLVISVGPDVPNVLADAQFLTAVFHELIENAIAYSPKDSTIVVRAKKEGKVVRVDVADQGCGIPASDLSKMFSRFMRGYNAEHFKPVGNGLGLFIAKSIVESLGGRISLKSKEGEGTTVSFTVPVGK